MTETPVVRDFLAAHLPDYAREHMNPLVDWEWLAGKQGGMLSSGESAAVTLAAHLWPVPYVVERDPRPLVALLAAVDWETRRAWAEACVAVEKEFVR
jgi:hypothetical protein